MQICSPALLRPFKQLLRSLPAISLRLRSKRSQGGRKVSKLTWLRAGKEVLLAVKGVKEGVEAATMAGPVAGGQHRALAV